MKRRKRHLWQFLVRNKFTLVKMPLCFVYGTTSENAKMRLWRWLDKTLYEVEDAMVVENPDMFIMTDYCFPDIRSMEYVQVSENERI